jgi:signal transduction histidine kinase/ligand-binding sensor domain-containing protein
MTIVTAIKNHGFIIIFLLLMGYNFMQVSAQSTDGISRYGVAEGLSQNVVYCMYQDNDGFLWVGTHDGLNRFDGYSFKKFKSIPNNPSTLADNIIQNIVQDNEGDLWIVTSQYLHRLQKPLETFERYSLKSNMSNNTTITSSSKNTGHIRLLALSKSLLVVDTRNKLITKIKYQGKEPEFPKQKSGNIISNKNWGTLTLAPKGKTGIYQPDDQHLSLVPTTDQRLTSLHKQSLLYIYAGIDYLSAINEQHELFIIGQSGLAGRFNLRNHFTTKSLSELMLLHANSAGELIMVWPDKVEKYAWNSGKMLMPLGNVLLTTETTIWSAMVDNKEQLWMGTFGKGLLHYASRMTGINTPAFHSNLTTKQSHIIAQLTHTSTNKIIAGYYPVKDTLLAYTDGKEQAITINEIFRNPTLSADIFHLKAGDMQYLPSLEKMVKQSELRLLNRQYFLKDSANKVWWCSDQTILTSSGTPIFDAGAYIESLVEDESHNWWLGTRGNGLICFNPHQKTFTKYVTTGDTNSLISNFINQVLYDHRRNMVWIATHHGLSSLNKFTGSIKNYSSKEGLCHPHIYSMVMDKSGNLWLGTGNGLSRLEPDAGQFTTYNPSDGLVNDEYNRNAASIGAEGYLYFGGTSGIDIINPALLSRKFSAPDTRITSFRATEEELPLESSITLQTAQNHIRIGFAAMDFRHPSKTLYAYRLGGHQKEWTTTMGQHEVTYGALPPDKYLFEVKAAVTPNDWGPVTQIAFLIKTPWWQQWWFYGLTGIAFMGAVYGFMKYRMRQQLKVIELRQRIQRDLHDDVGATLSSVKAYADILQEQPGNSMIAGLIQSNAEEMIDRLDVIAWSTNPHHDTLESLIEKIKIFAYPLLSASGIRFSVISEIGNKHLLMPGNLRQHLYLITKEAVNNVAKHSMASKCTLYVAIKNGHLRWQIQDDGKGALENDKQGNGIANMMARAKEAGGNLSWYSEHGKGCTILVSLPYPFKSTS